MDVSACGIEGVRYFKTWLKTEFANFYFLVKEILDFIDLSKDDIPSEVETFIQSVQQDYLK
ncbi:hypothetical protein [Peribacillus butanolivorans]|uniref:hypothetical protein n=1 Tax=Peribacillus butanolivorans TaxID=421767 RepID=UPI0011459130|nr:hypothetical protein [Peribacillus butanolivorans]